MKDQLKGRLKDLSAEFQLGQKLLADLEGKTTHIRSSLLRISGAIQVLEELLNEEHAREREAGHPVNGAAPVSAPVG